MATPNAQPSIESLTGRSRRSPGWSWTRDDTAIADDLSLGRESVETHLRHIFEKTEVSSRAALARAIERPQRSLSPPRV